MTPEYASIARLKGEEPCRAEIRNERGAPRLIVNNKEVFPLLAWSWLLEPSVYHFRRSGIRILHPILGFNAAWKGPDQLDWGIFARHFDELLAGFSEAYFLPRLHLDVPEWWKDQYPDELTRTAIPPDPKNPRQYRSVRINPEGGMAWGIPLREVSLASDRWLNDMTSVLRSFCQFVESSPLASRVIGYQIGAGIYGEWHYPMAEFLPDIGPAAQRKIGPAPTAEQRLHTEHGLVRDPVKERGTIRYFERLHREVSVPALLHFAKVAKTSTSHRVLVGAFQTYLLENVWIQEGGHLAPEAILRSPEIDFIAGPYSYQTTNKEDRPWYEHDVYDDFGTYLGRSRGVGGDGGYRVLLESLRRAGKLFFAEIDPSTYLEPHPENAPDDDIVRELPLLGGVGSTTPEGTRDVLRRDIGRLIVSGCGGWLFDFGPTLATKRSWYADEPIVQTVRELMSIGETRAETDLGSVAEIAALYDPRSFFYTRHWLAEAPFQKGSVNLDIFSKWFLTSQSRALHRVGAPVDFLYHFDLQHEDLDRYRLLLVPNLVFLPVDERRELRSKLSGTGVTVVWYYGPGLLAEDGLDAAGPADLMGMTLRVDTERRSMSIDSQIDPQEPHIGFEALEGPRLAVDDERAEVLGTWTDTGEPAIARKSSDGFTSVFVGSAPIPVRSLRRLAADAGARLWSSEPDVVLASRDWAMIVATSQGERSIRLHRPLKDLSDQTVSRDYHIHTRRGQVILFGPA